MNATQGMSTDVEDWNVTVFYNMTANDITVESNTRTELIEDKNGMYALYGVIVAAIVFGIMLVLIMYCISKLWNCCQRYEQYKQDELNMQDIEIPERRHNKTTTIPSMNMLDIRGNHPRESSLDARISTLWNGKRQSIDYVV